MESAERPKLFYLAKGIAGTVYILEATDEQAVYLREYAGLQWHGVPFKTRTEAEAALEAIKTSS
jgi:hypothetical protein